MVSRRLRLFLRLCARSFEKNTKPWRNQAGAIRKYWYVYGGKAALFRSPYLHIAVFIFIFGVVFGGISSKGAEIAVSVIPNILGFTIGAMAIVLSMSSTSPFVHLAEEGEIKSFFMRIVAILVHFVIVQACALIFGIIGKTVPSSIASVFDYLAYLFLIYAVTSAISVAVQLFLAAQALNASASIQSKDQDTPPNSRD